MFPSKKQESAEKSPTNVLDRGTTRLQGVSFSIILQESEPELHKNLLGDFWFPKSLEFWLRLFLVYYSSEKAPANEWFPDQGIRLRLVMIPWVFRSPPSAT